MRLRGPGVLAAARGRAGLGSGARGPGTLGSAPAAAAAAQEPPASGLARLREPLRLRCSRGGKRTEEKTSCPRVCMHGGAARGQCRGGQGCWKLVWPPALGQPPWLGLAARVPLQATSSEQPRARPGSQEEAPEGWTPRNGHSLCPLGGARHGAAKSQVGVSAPSHPQTLQLGTGSLHSVPSNFRGRGA